ncbi:unnamed protein product [Urochloa humidicola]
MDLVTGAVGSLASKLLQLLGEEYTLQTTGLTKQVQSLSAELESIRAFLHKVGNVPWYRLDEQIKVWAREVRDKCYDVEDVFDSFLVHLESPETAEPSILKRAMHKMGDFTKGKARHDIANDIEGVMKQLIEVAARRNRYKIDDSIEYEPSSTTVDPRLPALYKKTSELVGIDEPRDALIEMLSIGGHEKKIISIVGPGGLGKTTLAMAVYDKLININQPFDCCAFVPVGQNPDIKKILRDILIGLKNPNKINALDEKRLSRHGYLNELDEKQLIDELRDYLKGKRYFIVVDDIWETLTWRTVELAFVDGTCGSRVLTTTRKLEVSKEIGEVYKLDELSDNNSKKLFYSITFGWEEKRLCSDELDKVSDTVIKKCRGLPLAIVTIAGVLARKPIEEWSTVYDSIGFGPDDNKVEDMKKILSFSYYDLPPHLRTCLLYLSIFPEEQLIGKRELILRWVAEGFIHEESGKAFFDVGDSYLHELIDRNLVIPIKEERSGVLQGCRIHDMLLRLIRQLSTEENFAVALDKDERSSVEQSKIRRLALRMLTEETKYKDMARLRSFNAIICFTELIPPVCSFKVLRVLVLEYCIGMEDYPIKHIAKLLHLRYIGLSHSPIRKLPKEIGHLKFLQTLLLDDTGIKELPSSMRLLKQLMCLRVDEKTSVPDWIGEMTSLMELEMYHALLPNLVIRVTPRIQEQETHSGADNKCSTRQFVKKLGNLRNLRVLKTGVHLRDQGQGREFLESLSKLHNMQDISIVLPAEFLEIDVDTKARMYALSSSLRTLELLNLQFSKLPAWMNGQCLPKLCKLKVLVNDVDEQDLRNLGTLRELRDLALSTTRNHRLKLTICGCGGFQDLKFLHLISPLQFVQGAMPRLEDMVLCIKVFALKDANISFDFGLENLSSLQSLTVGVDCADASPEEVEEAEAAIRHAVDIHPNHPSLSVVRSYEDKMGPADADSRMIYRQMYKSVQDSTLNKQIKKLDDQIDVQNNCNSTLYNQAQEMAHKIPEGHPSIAKIQWSSVYKVEMAILQKQLADRFQTINDTSDPDQLMQHIKLQELLFDLYKVENKRMAAIVEELKAEVKISDNAANAEGKGEQRGL